MAGLLLVGLSVGLSNFAGAIGIGLGGVTAAVRIRVAVLFGLFEAGMPVLGLLIGHRTASLLGADGGRYLGGALLVLTGLWALVAARRSGGAPAAGTNRRLVVTAAALSIDNLVVGFALGTLHVNLAVAAAVIAGVSVVLSLAGLELGHRLGKVVERYSEEVGGLVLVGVGVAVASGLMR
ncbi:MAG TPA: manganese efflux pump [Acidimicrobiales bacterium]|nr:manganese efflux pump [Acidimicrobiales bacterium]